ncbi:MAG: MAPEG family protein [Kangiellaceae bacterium]
MSNTLSALILYIAWFLSILLILGLFRSYLTLAGKKAANSFSPTGADVSPFSARLCRAHANCYEFFPIAGGLMLAALATGNTMVTEEFAMYLAYARILQSTVHIISTSLIAVYIRFALFFVQIGISICWIIGFCNLG